MHLTLELKSAFFSTLSLFEMVYLVHMIIIKKSNKFWKFYVNTMSLKNSSEEQRWVIKSQAEIIWVRQESRSDLIKRLRHLYQLAISKKTQREAKWEADWVKRWAFKIEKQTVFFCVLKPASFWFRLKRWFGFYAPCNVQLC